jgi:hypothetical protein
MPPKWPPDWTNPTQYPDPKNTSAVQWAWEFLRRNKAYQQLWFKEIGPNYNAADLDASWKSAGNIRPQQRTRIRAKKPSSLSQSFYITADPPPSPLNQFREKFHILTYPPSPLEDKAKLYFDAQFIPYEGPAAKAHEVARSLKQNEMVLWFNLTWPLKEQLANAKKLLEKQTKENKNVAAAAFRVRAEHYPLYLRVLDAKTAGIADAAIVKALYPTRSNKYPNHNASQHLRDDIKAAQRLRDRDFWLIAVAA